MAKAKMIHHLNWKAIEQLMRETNRRMKRVEERVMFYARCWLGAPYVLYCLGEGIEAKYDPDPLMDMGRVDCMTFCEQVLALAISRSYRDAFYNLQRIRYHQGVVGFATRNHFTVVDWLPHNSWLLYDVTEEIGGEFTDRMEKTIDQRNTLERLAKAKLPGLRGATKMQTVYIPKTQLSRIKQRLRGGEIVSLITRRRGVFSAHMGLMSRQGTRVSFIHASREEGKVVELEFARWVRYLKGREKEVGVKFFRLREGVNFWKPAHRVRRRGG